MVRPLLMVASLSSLLLFPLVDAAIKGTIVLLLAGGICLLLRRDSAATRHLVWATAVTLLLAMPLLSIALPQWRILPSWIQMGPGIASSTGSNPHPTATDARTTETSRSRQPAGEFVGGLQYDSPPHSTILSEIAGTLPVLDRANMAAGTGSRDAIAIGPATLFVLVWFVGCGSVVLRFLMGVIQLRRSQRRCLLGSRLDVRRSTIDDRGKEDALRAAMDAAAVQLGLKRPVQLLLDPQPSIPVVWGILRPRLRLPEAAVDWSAEQQQSVLLHELAHVRRHDLWVLAITQFACALHWFNPLVWCAAWRLHVERERACDDLVLASGVRASAYAEHLLHVATKLSPARWIHACGLAMARKSCLEGRLVAVLSKNLNRRGVSVALAATALAVAASIAVPLAMLHAADEKPDEPPPPQRQESQEPKDGAKLPGRLFVNAGLRTAKDATRFSQSAIAIDPNTGTWTRLRNLYESGFSVPLAPVRVSPDGRTMLYVQENEIWKCNAITGEHPARVVQKGQPKAWAPDGKEFILVVEKEAGQPDRTENWRVSADGKKQSVLSLPIGDVVEDWSTDGRWLLGWSHADGQLYIMKPDGSGRRQLTTTNSNASRNEHPRFSPDGRRIVYLCDCQRRRPESS